MNRLQNTRWGRWRLEDNCLCYTPREGEADPAYELSLAEHEGPQTIKRWQERLSEKSWISPDVLKDLRTACNCIGNEELWDDSRFDAPEPMSYSQYAAIVNSEWRKLLSNADSMDERIFQAFLETHPSLLPGMNGTPGHFGHEPPIWGSFSQPDLPGAPSWVPDFMVVVYNTACVHPVLIEIEAPGKSWSTGDARPSAKLIQALDQLRNWQRWFSEPRNVLAFQELYRIDPEMLRGRQFVPQFVLVYGRRADAQKSASFAAKISTLTNANEYLMSFDRLKSSGDSIVTLKLDRSGPDTGFRVVTVPPTISLSRRNIRWFAQFSGREAAINGSVLMTEERREFLLKRVAIGDECLVRKKACPEQYWYL